MSKSHCPDCGSEICNHGFCPECNPYYIKTGFAADLKFMEKLITAALLDSRREALEEAAELAKHSNFVDGPLGTIEGQIGQAIRRMEEE